MQQPLLTKHHQKLLPSAVLCNMAKDLLERQRHETLSRYIRAALHCEGLSRPSLPICKHCAVVPFQDAGHNRLNSSIVHLRKYKCMVSTEGGHDCNMHLVLSITSCWVLLQP